MFSPLAAILLFYAGMPSETVAPDCRVFTMIAKDETYYADYTYEDFAPVIRYISEPHDVESRNKSLHHRVKQLIVKRPMQEASTFG